MALGSPKILYDNHLANFTVIVSSEDATKPKERLFDNRPHLVFSPATNATLNIDIDLGSAGTTTDAIGIINHDMFTQTASWEVFSDDNSGFSSATSLSGGAQTPTDNRTVYADLTVATERYIRIQIVGMDAVGFFGQIIIGGLLTLSTQPDWGYSNLTVEPITRSHKSGTGRTMQVKKDSDLRLVRGTIQNIPVATMQSDIAPFIFNHLKEFKNFFYVHDTEILISRAVFYMRARDGVEVTIPFIGVDTAWNFEFEGVLEDEWLT